MKQVIALLVIIVAAVSGHFVITAPTPRDITANGGSPAGGNIATCAASNGTQTLLVIPATGGSFTANITVNVAHSGGNVTVSLNAATFLTNIIVSGTDSAQYSTSVTVPAYTSPAYIEFKFTNIGGTGPYYSCIDIASSLTVTTAASQATTAVSQATTAASQATTAATQTQATTAVASTAAVTTVAVTTRQPKSDRSHVVL